MSKTRRRYSDFDYFDGEYDVRQDYKDKKRERRYQRALRTKSIDELVHEDGIDPDDYDNMVEDDLVSMEHDRANI